MIWRWYSLCWAWDRYTGTNSRIKDYASLQWASMAESVAFWRKFPMSTKLDFQPIRDFGKTFVKISASGYTGMPTHGQYTISNWPTPKMMMMLFLLRERVKKHLFLTLQCWVYLVLSLFFLTFFRSLPKVVAAVGETSKTSKSQLSDCLLPNRWAKFTRNI